MNILKQIGVCSWSLQPENPRVLVDYLNGLGIKKLQCALDPLREHPDVWFNLPTLCKENGIEIVSGMFTCVGEDYSTLERIKKTGGIVPDETWEQNKNNIKKSIEIASKLNLKLVTFHAGFIPHNKNDASFNKLLDRLREVAKLFAEAGIELGLETGQETAETLKELLKTLNCENVVVNFDPANMILYDKGDPVEALQVLYPYIRQCHLKDAKRTKTAGEWGEEVPLGTGDVDWEKFLKFLKEKGFSGNLCIEREAGNERLKDIKTAYNYIINLMKE
ncbi:MAG TPA: sugar phosphate isomerase/epimerase family protein [Verrucomicrobiota bacterium]|nr:sugar phosphate isomerase/epimerase family protein [Verrucomicrobiota bacterium]